MEEDLTIWQADLRREMDFGSNSGYLKGGYKFTGREKTSDLGGTSYGGFEDDLLLSQFFVPGRVDFYNSERPGLYEFGPVIDYDRISDFFNSNQSGFEVEENDTSENEFAEDYRVDEDVTAAYLMAGTDIGQWTLTGGMRVEKTESDYSAFQVDFEDGAFAEARPVSGGQSYTDWMPGFLVRYQATRDLLLERHAWSANAVLITAGVAH